MLPSVALPAFDVVAEHRHPHREPLPAEPRPVCWEGAPLAPTDARLATAGISIGPHTATPEWYGESLILQAALDVPWEPAAAVAKRSVAPRAARCPAGKPVRSELWNAARAIPRR